MSWTPIDCQQRDTILTDIDLAPISGRSDMSGEFGDPRVETIWGHRDTDTPTLKDIRHPRYEWDSQAGDRLPCEHYEWTNPEEAL